MDFTTYLEQINRMKQITSFVNSPAIQNAIQIRDRWNERLEPIQKIRENYFKMEKSMHKIVGMNRSIQALNDRMMLYTSSEIKEILNKNQLITPNKIVSLYDNNIIRSINVVKEWNRDISRLKTAIEAVKTLYQQEKLYETLDSISDTVYDGLLADTEYEKKDILEGVEKFSEFVDTLEDTKEDEDIVELFETKKKEFYITNPIYYIIVLIITFLANMGDIKLIYEDVYLSMIQDAIIMAEGNDDVYFSKVDIAEIYAENVSGSAIVGSLFYGDKVKGIEDTNMWLKVLFTDENGNECTGWVAKGKLMDYKTWKYNADSLYTMGN